MKTFWIWLGLTLLSTPALAVEPGERLAFWSLNDQFDRPYTLDDSLQVLLVARSMEGAKLLEQAMAGREPGSLEARGALFLADVSRMPKLIGSLFAIPAMRDYPYRVLLDREAQVVPRYRAPEKGILWLQLEGTVVRERREYLDSAQLSAALEQLAP